MMEERGNFGKSKGDERWREADGAQRRVTTPKSTRLKPYACAREPGRRRDSVSTDLIGVLTVTVGEVRRSPAADLVPDVATSGDDQREDDHQVDGVLTVEAVTETVAAADARVPDVGDCRQEGIHFVLLHGRHLSMMTGCSPSNVLAQRYTIKTASVRNIMCMFRLSL